MTTPFRTLPQSKYPGLPLTYITAIAEKKGLTLEIALPIVADCGDVDRAWQGDDNDKQDYLDAVDSALSRHLDQQRPEFKKRNNTWAENDHMLQRVLRSSRMRLYGLFPEGEVDGKLCEIWKVPTLNDLHLLKGSDDKAIKTIEQWKAGFMATTNKKIDGKNQPSLMDEKPKVNIIALGQEIGAIFAEYGAAFSGVNYQKFTHESGISASLANGKSPDTIKAQIRAGLVAEQEAGKVKAEPEKLGDEIDLDLSEGAAKLQSLLDADEKTEDTEKIDEKATPLVDVPETKADTQPETTGPVPDPVPAKADEPETIEATVVEEDLPLDGEEEFEGREYSYDANWTDASKRWKCELTTYVKFAPEQIPGIEKSITGSLQLSRQSPVEFSWHHLAEPPVDKITEARKSADVLIKNAWKDWDNEESVNLRVDKLREILGVTAMPVALATYGYKGTLKRVQDATLAKIKADDEEQRKRHEEESKRFEEKALSTTVKQTQVAVQSQALVGINYFTVRIPSPEQIPAINALAEAAFQAGIYKNVGQAKLAIWRGCELGLPMSMSVQEIFIINNRPYESAVALKAAVLGSGMVERFQIKVDSERAIATVQRKGGEINEVIYTMDEARKANLVGKDNWLKNPKMMLVHRVTRQAIKIEFADVAAGLGLRIEEEDDDDAGDLPKVANF